MSTVSRRLDDRRAPASGPVEAAGEREAAPIRPVEAPADAPRLSFKRGRRSPRAIAWFGARSFYGHLWHLAASVIATEDIDSRKWMTPDDPDELTARIAGVIGGRFGAPTLADALDDDVWIDFVADTGDDSSVSEAVARMIFARYEVRDPEDEKATIVLPRGHLLIFGGDTAYPVATELEIMSRVIAPFHRALRGAQDGKKRVLLGVPGNHDWYAGLDGFGRMFRVRRGRVDRASRLPDKPVMAGGNGAARGAVDGRAEMAPMGPKSAKGGPSAEDAEREEPAQLEGPIEHFFEWMEAFRVGRFVAKRPALPLEGYEPVQSATYWAVRLAPGLDLWGPDRQLRALDLDQRAYFAEERERSGPRGLVLCVADPVRAFLEPNWGGVDVLRGLGVSLANDGPLVLTGDTHHYCREVVGKGMHVTAGGGGAFLHPARIVRRGLTPPAAEFPGPRASLALALQVPWQIVHGRSGFLVHGALAIVYLPTCGPALFGEAPGPALSGATAAAVAIACFFLGGWRSGKAVRIGLLACAAGAAIGALPLAMDRAVSAIAAAFDWHAPASTMAAFVFAASIYGGTLAFGTFLMLLTILGLEQHQAFGALAHPGYKHFVRLRVRRDGSAVDGWVLGKVDPLRKNEPVVLVDRFTWTSPLAKER